VFRLFIVFVHVSHILSATRLQDRDRFLLTPFERNLEVWRQLWRVLERSHLVVQIVDARNPLRFRCADLDAYVQDVEGPEGEKDTGKGLRRSLLLINKADLLTATQRYNLFGLNEADLHN
jgi:large subunit GTPase 1